MKKIYLGPWEKYEASYERPCLKQLVTCCVWGNSYSWFNNFALESDGYCYKLFPSAEDAMNAVDEVINSRADIIILSKERFEKLMVLK